MQFGLELVVEDDAEAIFVHVAPGYDVLRTRTASSPRCTGLRHDRARLEALKVARTTAFRNEAGSWSAIPPTRSSPTRIEGRRPDRGRLPWARRDRERAARQRLARSVARGAPPVLVVPGVAVRAKAAPVAARPSRYGSIRRRWESQAAPRPLPTGKPQRLTGSLRTTLQRPPGWRFRPGARTRGTRSRARRQEAPAATKEWTCARHSKSAESSQRSC